MTNRRLVARSSPRAKLRSAKVFMGVFLGAAACAPSAGPDPPRPPSAPPARTETPAPPPHSPHVGPRRPYPEGAIALPPPPEKECLADLALTARREKGAVVLTATLRATKSLPAPQRVALRGPCPGGPVQIVGLGSDYDVFGRCAMGACPAPTEVTEVVLPKGRAPVVVQELRLPEKGDGCRGPLPEGKTEVYAAAALESPSEFRLCGDPRASFELPRRPAPPRPPAHTCQPGPTCGLACPGPFAHDEHGCTLCACEDESITR